MERWDDDNINQQNDKDEFNNEVMIDNDDENQEIILDSLIPPYRFCMIDVGIYRGAYPTLPNFRFLSRLQLRTIISLIPEKPTEDLKLFSEMASINILHFPIERIATFSPESQATLAQALEVLKNPNNRPIFLHCLDGRRISSLLVLLFRKTQGWAPIPSFAEYWRFQLMFKPQIPGSEIEKTTKDIEKFCSQFP